MQGFMRFNGQQDRDAVKILVPCSEVGKLWIQGKDCQLLNKGLISSLGLRTYMDLTLLDAGGGGIRPPYHTFVIPRKKLMGKVANFFLLFLNM